MIITKAQLDQWRAERARPTLTQDYTIGGAVETELKTLAQETLEKNIRNAERHLDQAHIAIQCNNAYARQQGLAKAQFNHANTNSNTSAKPNTTKEITP
ncbi:MAG: hypothetical protein ACRBB4_15660 [Neptuniibacter sp.]